MLKAVSVLCILTTVLILVLTIFVIGAGSHGDVLRIGTEGKLLIVYICSNLYSAIVFFQVAFGTKTVRSSPPIKYMRLLVLMYSIGGTCYYGYQIISSVLRSEGYELANFPFIWPVHLGGLLVALYVLIRPQRLPAQPEP